MPTRTRRSTRSESNTTPSLSGTPTVGASPMFSTATTPQATPDTSEEDEEKPVNKGKTTARKVTATSKNKRGIQSDDEKPETATKRRRMVCVEISVPPPKVDTCLFRE